MMTPHRWLGPALLLAAAGCTGEIALPDGGTALAGSGSASSSGSAGSTNLPGAGDGPVSIGDVVGVDPETLPDGVPASSRVLRLAYRDYDRTLSDLLQLPVTDSLNFPEEQPNLGPYEGNAERSVSEKLLNELVRSAETLASRVIETPAAYAAVVGCDPAASGCRDTFIDGFGLRALRRPLTDAERGRYRALFDSAAGLLQSGDAFRDGVQLVLEALLQSPKVLYRVEVGDGTSDAQGTRLTGYEVAQRLSYMLWGTTPDAGLLAAAASGALASAEGVAAQAGRLALDARFTERMLDFHERWMQLDELKSLTKDPATFPQFSSTLVGSMRAETRRFIEEVMLNRGGSLSALLTAPFGYADSQLAAVYGLPGSFGSELTEVSYDASSARGGLFTQASFLAGHSSSSKGTSPILRGVFLLRRVACATIPDPPAGAQMLEPEQPPATAPKTTRDYFTWKTSMQSCAGCHTMINPTGFAFEQFDGIGQLRTTENGAPIDATGSVTIRDDGIAFDGAKQLLSGLSSEAQVRACYAKNWLQFAYGRDETEADLRALGLAARDLATSGFTMRALATSLTARPAFTHLPLLTE